MGAKVVNIFTYFLNKQPYFLVKKNLLFVKYHIKKYYIFALRTDGALAQLARAFDWQSRGHEFDSHMLHKLAKANDLNQGR